MGVQAHYCGRFGKSPFPCRSHMEISNTLPVVNFKKYRSLTRTKQEGMQARQAKRK